MQKITSFAALDLSKTYSYADYLTWWFDERVELIKGKIFNMSPAPSMKHQRVLTSISYEIIHVFKRKSCKVFLAPFDVRLHKKDKKDDKDVLTVVQPDICVVCDPAKLDERGCIGAPDLVVEILSPHTSKKDLNDKYQIYEENGVKEYWVVYPGEEYIEVYTLANDKYVRHDVYANDETLQSVLFPNLKIDIKEVFEN